MVNESLYHDLQKWRAYALFFGPFCFHCSLALYFLGAFLIKQLDAYLRSLGLYVWEKLYFFLDVVSQGFIL